MSAEQKLLEDLDGWVANVKAEADRAEQDLEQARESMRQSVREREEKLRRARDYQSSFEAMAAVVKRHFSGGEQ